MGAGREAGNDLTSQAIDWLVALDHGNADEAAFEAWRSADPRHAAVFAQVAATWRRTSDRRVAAQLDHDEPVVDEPASAEDSPDARLISRRAVAAGAAALAFGLGGAAFVAWPRRAYAETAIGERRTVALPDGSHAMLNTDSRVAWRFDDGRDFWIERGEAALLVRAGAAPFRVHSDPIDARLSPGSFNLRLDHGGGELLVVAGRAAAAYRDAEAGTIDAGHRLIVSAGAATVEPLPASALAVATAWQHGEIIFDGMQLDRAVAEFNRYLPNKIVLGDPGLAATQLGGDFRIAAPDSFLAALRDGFGIGSRRDGDRIVLYRADSGEVRASRS
ncbi:MAG: FecR family protein [Sphingomonas sp.]